MNTAALWQQFGDTPVNPDTDEIETEFLHFEVGTPKMEVWHWFDQQFPNGLGAHIC